jgi:peptidoglycan DL-endopeptidase CwlO
VPPPVATPRTSPPSRPSSLLRPARTGVRLLLAAVVLVLAPAALPAVAEPPASTADVRRELAELEARADAAVEDYAEVRLALAAARRGQAAAAGRLARADAALTAARAGLADLVRAAYVNGGHEELLGLLSSADPDAFLSGATTLDRIARGRSAEIRRLLVLRRSVEAERRRLADAVADQDRVERRLAAARRSVEDHAARQSALLRRLEGADAARRAAAERERRAARASRSDRASVEYDGPASGRAAIAVREAYRQLGKPYRWGAAGPDRFDCSGLTMWVWGKAGVSLPHSSRAQFRHGVHVSKSQLRPGDLVFYGSPIHHVGIYVGGGRYIAAPRTGDVVGFRNVNRGDYAGAVRL